MSLTVPGYQSTYRCVRFIDIYSQKDSHFYQNSKFNNVKKISKWYVVSRSKGKLFKQEGKYVLNSGVNGG